MKLYYNLFFVFIFLINKCVYGCQTDLDCSLNGICINFNCTCDSGWTGNDCGVLDLVSIDMFYGYRSPNNWNTWDATIIKDVHSNKFHMFASQFKNGCGLNQWSPYSYIIHAVSENGALGPFEYQNDVLPTFHHNPSIIYDNISNTYFLYVIGCNITVPSSFCNDTTTFTCGIGNDINGESGISIYSSQSLDSLTWTFVGNVLNGSISTDITNPSPLFINHTNILLAIRQCPYNCYGEETIYLSLSTNGIQGPYNMLTNGPILHSSEDPFIWIDKRQNYHMLVHWVGVFYFEGQEFIGGFGGNTAIGRHAFTSNVSGNWIWSNTISYTTNVSLANNTYINLYRRERPFLIFSEDGERTPIAIVNGVQLTDANGPTQTLIIPTSAYINNGTKIISSGCKTFLSSQDSFT